MSPVEDDPAVWVAFVRYWREVMDGMAFTTPFWGPAFLGALLNAIWRKHLRRGAAYLLSAVFSSTVAGAVLTPLFAHVAGFPDGVSGSTAAFVAIVGYEVINRMFGSTVIGGSKPWDGTERRKDRREEEEG